jgi:uncharacterized protein
MNLKTIIFAITFITLSSLNAAAQTGTEIRDRMAARLPAIDQLKSEQLVGENNQAYLTVLAPLDEAKTNLIQEENADRRVVYSMLARQAGAPIEVVQQRRAEQLREIAKPGTRVQLPNGDWTTKE